MRLVEFCSTKQPSTESGSLSDRMFSAYIFPIFSHIRMLVLTTVPIKIPWNVKTKRKQKERKNSIELLRLKEKKRIAATLLLWTLLFSCMLVIYCPIVTHIFVNIMKWNDSSHYIQVSNINKEVWKTEHPLYHNVMDFC